ncbi:hypothetical protein HNY73_004190 [Argiope bruennichi]|uniref:Uncharacterized protein n=1 Tax=Argiope bruennichi TaxID=94029 RepID=A0A8T0FP33_ARGBR|nr:hypothetical protein HNY73_004190 [Argiope bruennichi]
METIFDTPKECQCFECTKDAPLPSLLLERIWAADGEERRRLLQHAYYAKPFLKKSWTKDWRSMTHKDYTFQYDIWSTYFPERFPNKQLTDYVCRKWCDEEHNPPLQTQAYTAQTMPDLFDEPRRAIYSQPRKCESIYGQDYTWKNDYRPQGRFPGWCLRGKPPRFDDYDKN